ncbi:MAG TPA: tRNA (N6-threonylcarbamoyladenosine(37)-N6)-methyltransferase TrmO [Anaerolineales bacterium]|nr:tRNA (N6-threonylcarbamoyladenosine(37)-N6)-methyltransferase TrmO [Anaerolineales bacterium]
MEFSMQPIGVIHSPFSEGESTPIQASRSQARGTVEVFSQYADGLDGIDGFSYVYLFYILHRSEGYSLRVTPFLDDQLHGVFATRYPLRPNALGFSLVRLLGVQANILEVEGLDVWDGTPLLDIKPYVPDFDQRDHARAGWYETRSKK